jgi:hypothetical protein
VGGISGERFYLAVVVGTHELVKMLRLGADLVLQYISIIRAPPWCLNFGHLVPKPDFPHHPTPHHSTEYSTAVSCNIADYSTVLYRLAQTKTRTQCTLAAVVHTIKQCSVDVGGISGERFYLAVVVGTHELVKMLRLGADLVFVLGEHLATLVNS